VTLSGLLNQPFESATREVVAPVTVGAVASYLSAKLAAPVLPATSRHVPGTDVDVRSGPE
jgi:hypothetical protein